MHHVPSGMGHHHPHSAAAAAASAAAANSAAAAAAAYITGGPLLFQAPHLSATSSGHHHGGNIQGYFDTSAYGAALSAAAAGYPQAAATGYGSPAPPPSAGIPGHLSPYGTLSPYAAPPTGPQGASQIDARSFSMNLAPNYR